MGIYYHKTIKSMKETCDGLFRKYPQSMVIAYNDEDDGGKFEVSPLNDGSITSFEDRCSLAIETIFICGGWNPIVIATQLPDEETALAEKLVGEKLAEYLRINGEDQFDVLFNGRRFEMTYQLSNAPIDTSIDNIELN